MEKKNSFEKSFIGWLDLGWQIWGFLDMFFLINLGPVIHFKVPEIWVTSSWSCGLAICLKCHPRKKKTLVFTCPINRHIANRKTGILRDIAATSKHISRRYYWSRQYVFHQDQRETASHHWIPGTEKVWKFQTIRWDHRTVPNPDWLLVSNMVWNGFI